MIFRFFRSAKEISVVKMKAKNQILSNSKLEVLHGFICEIAAIKEKNYFCIILKIPFSTKYACDDTFEKFVQKEHFQK